MHSQISMNHAWTCSPLTKIVYHDRNGDGGNRYYPAFGCPWTGGVNTYMESGLYCDNDMDEIVATLCSRLTKNLNYHLPTNVDNEQLFTQLLLIGGPWNYMGSGIFLSDPDPVNQIAFTLGSPLTKQSLS